jgi:serine/threonine protein kinase
MIPSELAPGCMWDKRYRIVAHLGSGAAAHAFAAEDTTNAQVVALKVLNLTTFHGAAPLRDEILGDAILRRRLIHPSIVPVRDFSLTPRPYSAADFCEQHSPHTLLEKNGPPSRAQLLSFARELTGLCLGLRAAGVIWLDVSISNVNLADAAPPWTAIRVVDLGAFVATDPALRAALEETVKLSRQDAASAAAVTQARRVRLLLRLVALWKIPDASKQSVAVVRPELADLAEWLDQHPANALDEPPLEKWAALIGAETRRPTTRNA